VSLPICIASGILALGPLGSSYVAAGASAGLCGAIVGGLVSAMAASSSFVMTSPRVSSSLVLASLIGGLSTTPGVLMDPAGLVASVFLCALLAGLWQCAFGLAGFSSTESQS
jgi:SulP family sulfate permease